MFWDKVKSDITALSHASERGEGGQSLMRLGVRLFFDFSESTIGSLPEWAIEPTTVHHRAMMAGSAEKNGPGPAHLVTEDLSLER